MGKKKDDTLVIQLNTAFEEKEREWITSDLGIAVNEEGALDKYFKMTITKVGLVEKPEMNEEFFSQAFPGKNLANEGDFRQAVRDATTPTDKEAAINRLAIKRLSTTCGRNLDAVYAALFQ